MSKFSKTDDKLKSLIRDKGLSTSRIRGYDIVMLMKIFGMFS